MGRQGNQPTRSKGDRRPMTKAQAVTKRSSPRGDARKKRIIEVATSMLARNGSHGTTPSDIAAAAGVSQAGGGSPHPPQEKIPHPPPCQPPPLPATPPLPPRPPPRTSA